MQAQLTVVTVLKEIVGYLQRGREDLRYNGLMVHSKPATQDAHFPSLNPKIAQTNNNAGTNYLQLQNGVYRVLQNNWQALAAYN